jgi:triacylglycerol lipase
MPSAPRVEAGRLGSLALLAVALLGGCRSSPPVQPPVDLAPPLAEAGVDLGIPDRSVDRSPAREGLAGPPYPILLAHGFFGFNKIGPAEYFYKVQPALAAAGHQVFITVVDPFNSVSVRGEQLLTQTKDILQKTGAAKVNLIAHSQGGLDARYVASRIPGRVAAVVTLATPHLGTKVADAVLNKAPGFTVTLAQAVCDLAGRPFWGDIAKDPNLEASLESISSDGAAAFNAAYPDVDGVSYFSIAGRSNLALAEKECEAPKAPPFITKYAGERDPTHASLLLTAAICCGSLTCDDPNDGMVNVNSTKWGTWLGCIPADHMDEIGQFFGESPGIGNSFDYLSFYKELAGWLVARGF